MLSYIVPAFNEVKNIAPTVSTLHSLSADCGLSEYEIIVIDDGSTDGTSGQIKNLTDQFTQVVGLTHPVNLGLGSAIRSGIAAARFPHFMVVPGDNDVPHELIRQMLAVRTRADLILVAPLNKEIRTLRRNVFSMFYQLLYMIFFRVFVNYINGPGIWPTKKAREVKLRARRFSIISELNVKLLLSGCSFVEVPGYFRHGPKARHTVTLRNLIEVAGAFIALIYEIRVKSRDQFKLRSRRIPINFVGAEGEVSTSSTPELRRELVSNTP